MIKTAAGQVLGTAPIGAIDVPLSLDAERLITRRQLRALCGGVSDMWVHRRLFESGSSFPKPVKIAGRDFWRLRDLRDWIDAQAATRAS